MARKSKKDEPLVYNGLDELLEIMARERRKSLRNRKWAMGAVGLYIGLFIMAAIAAGLSHHRIPFQMLSQFGSFSGMLAAGFAATQAQRKGVAALAQFEDTRAVPRLLETLEYNDKGLKIDAANILQNLLPKMQYSDAALLGPEHRAILNRALSGKIRFDKYWTQQIQVAILKALQQVGDESSLPIVEELAEGKDTPKRDDVVLDAAVECLPFLRQRAEQQRQMHTLLRASDGNMTPTDVLLRPAVPSAIEVPAEQLLRASPAEGETMPEQEHLPVSAIISIDRTQQETQPLHLS